MQNLNFIEKIINNYKIAFSDRSKYGYPISEHWKKYYQEKNFNKFCKAENIINFRKDQLLSKGCDDSDKYASFLDIYEYIKEWKLDHDFLSKNLSKLNIGNNNTSYKFLNYYLDYAELVHLQFFNLIKDKIKNKINSIFEIGGGFGSLGRILINNLSAKYFLIDLPEANLISSYFLKEHFPNKKFFLYDDYKNLSGNSDVKISDSHIKENDIFILPPWTVNSFSKDIKIDFFVNTYSFMEMRYSIIQKYFDFIHKHSSDNCYFLNINRYIKDTSGERIKFSKYPYDSNWDCIISERSPIRYNQYFLFTQRKKFDFNKNIKQELEKLTKVEKGSYNSKEFIRFSNVPLVNIVEEKLRKISRSLLINVFGIKLLNKIGKKFYNISIRNK